MTNEQHAADCGACGVLNCFRRDGAFPPFCVTTGTDAAVVAQVTALYQEEGLTRTMAIAAAEVEGLYYGKLTRVEEIIAFAKRIGATKIGVATCVGLIQETQVFLKILRAKGLTGYTVACKVGSVDKTEIGIAEELKVQPGCHEALCNPVLQAELLNREGTDLNVIVGLCVGHDSLFIRHSTAPVTTLITKDRVLGHNPAAALYTSGFYYKRLLEAEKE
jgi:uncharacterized metal-binding protein